MKNKNMFYMTSASLLTSVGTGLTTFLIPWLLLKQHEGDNLFTMSFLLITISMFLLTPSIGSLIDSYSRRKIILVLEFSGLTLISLTLVSTYWTGNIPSLFLVILLFSQALYDSIKYSTIYAWTQNIFDKADYSKLNGIMEVQGQVALMLSAGLTALLVGKVDIQYILLVDIGTYIASIILYSRLPEGMIDRTSTVPRTKGVLKKTYDDFRYSLTYIKGNQRIFSFLFLTTLPSVIILVGNYLNPIFLYDYLNELPSIQGVSSVIFAFGAVLGGMAPILILKKMSMLRGIKMVNMTFLISFVLIALFPITAVFLASRVLAGISNSSLRVLRKDVMFECIPNHLIGRINTLLNSFSLLLRVLLISSFGIMISTGNVLYGYYLICGLLAICVAALFFFKPKDIESHLEDGAKQLITKKSS